ncbi:isopenicillin N synthase family dioxygenase [Chachezhania sediminis]|uniref:isopenicillin N synthase family dioxygenase n=1 Tax=Chachezhania sediminis TaxID=2599291 RepID=UPI00131E28A9|nr:2OG-Fe(II) oxygenase family protein [Chachezhania sediminis]
MQASPTDDIPLIDARLITTPLQDGVGAADALLVAAAEGAGFMRLSHVHEALGMDADLRDRILDFFALPEAQKKRLSRRKFAPAHVNTYRGYFPLQPGLQTYKEGIDIGADAVDPDRIADTTDALLEPTPWPENADDWRGAVATYYTAMERLGRLILAGLARGFGVSAELMIPLFDRSNSTLRMIRYPERTPDSMPEDLSIVRSGTDDPRWIVGGAHTDSGFITLLWQDDNGGLQAETRDGRWTDVPPIADGLAVNFGQLLEQWTGGRVRATRHRVMGGLRERVSVPFFYEPAVDAVIEPLPLPGIAPFAPFTYGDFLWNHMSAFVEFQGMDRMVTPVAAAE